MLSEIQGRSALFYSYKTPLFQFQGARGGDQCLLGDSITEVK